MAKFLQLSMDGQNTNWNVLNMISNHLVESGYKNLIKIVAAHSTLFMVPFKQAQQKRASS